MLPFVGIVELQKNTRVVTGVNGVSVSSVSAHSLFSDDNLPHMVFSKYTVANFPHWIPIPEK